MRPGSSAAISKPGWASPPQTVSFAMPRTVISGVHTLRAVFFFCAAMTKMPRTPSSRGTIIDIGLPVWRVGEILLYASRIARSYGDDPAISILARFTGLQGRRLGSAEPARRFFLEESRQSHDNDVELSTRATASELDDNIVEILQPFLAPLYERFGFFELRHDLIRAEITRMRTNRS